MYPYPRGLNKLQKISMSLMGVLVLLTFVAANLHAILWQSSEWLVSTVLPAVVVELTNDERVDNAAAPLRRNATLDEAARLKAEHMAKHEYFSHFSPDGTSPWYWFDEAGYVYAHAGENLAIHFTDSSEVVEAWMKSPAHRQNIVDGKFTEIGVGTAKGSYEGYNTVYVVQLFGTPAVPPTPAKTVPAAPVVTEVTPVVAVNVSEPTVAAQATEVRSSVEATELVSASDEAAAFESGPYLPTETDTELAVESEVEAISVVEIESMFGVSEVTDSSEDIQEIKTTEPTSLSVAAENKYEPERYIPVVTDNVVVLEAPIMATSSGLAIANITTSNQPHAGATAVSIATQPNTLLQIVYVTLGAIILFLLTLSIVLEARRFHYMQVAYGVMLIIGMGGLWYVHSLLTTGAVVV